MADRRALFETLGRVPLFSGLSRKELGAVLRFCEELDHPAGREVVREGYGSAIFHLILSGSATVVQGGRALRKLGPGDSFGDIALIDGGPRSAAVRADSALHTLSVATWNFKPLLLAHPTIAYKLLLELCRRLREAEARASLLSEDVVGAPTCS
jgi:CRP/FNR family transcriptional regulator, cyclic AMP receptor protein